MERGVVVGGLMICGSFLLAVSLNRSAVEESPPVEPAAADAPLNPPMTAVPADESQPEACAAGAANADVPARGDEPDEGDLPGNGREACSQ